MKMPKFYKQETSYSCTVACLRMVLEYYGIKKDENTLRIKSKTKFYGTHPVNVVECAKYYGFDAYVNSLTLNKLIELVTQNIPVIANILKFDGDEYYVHSVLIYRIGKNTVYLLDPEDGERKLDVSLFLRLWQMNNCSGIVIKKPS